MGDILIISPPQFANSFHFTFGAFLGHCLKMRSKISLLCGSFLSFYQKCRPFWSKELFNIAQRFRDLRIFPWPEKAHVSKLKGQSDLGRMRFQWSNRIAGWRTLGITLGLNSCRRLVSPLIRLPAM